MFTGKGHGQSSENIFFILEGKLRFVNIYFKILHIFFQIPYTNLDCKQVYWRR